MNQSSLLSQNSTGRLPLTFSLSGWTPALARRLQGSPLDWFGLVVGGKLLPTALAMRLQMSLLDWLGRQEGCQEELLNAYLGFWTTLE